MMIMQPDNWCNMCMWPTIAGFKAIATEVLFALK